VSDETGNHGWLHYDPDFYFNNIIDPAVQHVISKGMYAIIDWHYVGTSWTQSDVSQNTLAFWVGSGSWSGIASKYANNPNVIFELFNEPGGGEWSSWKSTAQGWISQIRSKGANNIVIVGGPNWSQTMPQSSGDLLTSDNIVYACHIYPSHIGGGIPNWIEYVSSVAPVMMTEWGYENNSDANVTTGTASSYGNTFKNYINGKTNVGWIAWCFDYCYRSLCVI
jgi:aryl-phospho-beta-D-glucosidase BglC (GH1 family)